MVKNKIKPNLIIISIILLIIIIIGIFFFSYEQAGFGGQIHPNRFPLFTSVVISDDNSMMTYSVLDSDAKAVNGVTNFDNINWGWWSPSESAQAPIGFCDMLDSFDFSGKSCYLEGTSSSGQSYSIEGEIVFYTMTDVPDYINCIPGCDFTGNVPTNRIFLDTGGLGDVNNVILRFKETVIPPECVVDTDCLDTYEGLVCNEENVMNKTTLNSCVSSECVLDTETTFDLIETCSDGCSNGECDTVETDTNDTDDDDTGTNVTTTTIVNGTNVTTTVIDVEEEPNLIFFGGVALGIVLIVGLIIFFMRNSKGKKRRKRR